MSKKIDKTKKPQPKSTVKTKHYPSGNIKSKTPYVSGKRHGMETQWDGAGRKWTERTWKDGKQHGMETQWRDDGTKLYEEMWKDDKQHGLETWRHNSGDKWSETMYKNGKKHGLETWCHENGTISREMIWWKDGERHGVTTMWYENGNREKEIYSVEGVEFARIHWDEEGNVIKTNFPPQSSTIKPPAKSKNQTSAPVS